MKFIIVLKIFLFQERQVRLFKAYETYTEKNNNTSGIGLGLNLCLKLSGYIGPFKNIWLKSELNKGSTFSFLVYQYSPDQENIDIDENVSNNTTISENLMNR